MRIALLISGNGTTAEQILRAVSSGTLKNIEPALVISSRADAPGIERAVNAGVPKSEVVVIARSGFPDESAFGEAIITACAARGIEFIGQYGWMTKTPANVIARFRDMIVNQHPAPLDSGRPDFGGKGMWGKRAVCARLLFARRVNRAFWTEATCHRVAAEYDQGAVVKAAKVPILPEDDADSLYARLYPAEYETQIAALRDFADGAVKEIIRDEPLVRPGEEAILAECKKEAISLYPHG